MSKAEKQHPEMLKVSEIGLKIYSPKSTGWPKTTLSLKQITKSLTEGKQKFTYTYDMINEEDMPSMITNNCTEITNYSFKVTEDSLFRKARPGLIEEYT